MRNLDKKARIGGLLAVSVAVTVGFLAVQPSFAGGGKLGGFETPRFDASAGGGKLGGFETPRFDASAAAGSGVIRKAPDLNFGTGLKAGGAVGTGSAASVGVGAGLGTNADAVSSQNSKTLFGGVDEIGAHADAADVDAQAGDANLKAEKGASGDKREQAFKLVAQKLAAGVTLTSEDYRSLDIGCIGLDVDRTYYQQIGTVGRVDPGSPADEAGVKVGERVIEGAIDDSGVSDPTVESYSVDFARAGTTTDVTLFRHKRPETITLTRINIEDIPDRKARELWEHIVQSIGKTAKSGTYSGRTLDSLQPVFGQ